MLCQNCGQRPATTHIKQLVNGQLTEAHLCAHCAQKQGYGGILGDWGGFGSLLGGLLGEAPAQQVVRRHVVVVAGPGDKIEPRLPDAVFVVTEQRLADPQRGGRLPLADALFLPEQGQDTRKIGLHLCTSFSWSPVSGPDGRIDAIQEV